MRTWRQKRQDRLDAKCKHTWRIKDSTPLMFVECSKCKGQRPLYQVLDELLQMAYPETNEPKQTPEQDLARPVDPIRPTRKQVGRK